MQDEFDLKDSLSERSIKALYLHFTMVSEIESRNSFYGASEIGSVALGLV